MARFLRLQANPMAHVSRPAPAAGAQPMMVLRPDGSMAALPAGTQLPAGMGGAVGYRGYAAAAMGYGAAPNYANYPGYAAAMNYGLPPGYPPGNGVVASMTPEQAAQYAAQIAATHQATAMAQPTAVAQPTVVAEPTIVAAEAEAPPVATVVSEAEAATEPAAEEAAEATTELAAVAAAAEVEEAEAVTGGADEEGEEGAPAKRAKIDAEA